MVEGTAGAAGIGVPAAAEPGNDQPFRDPENVAEVEVEQSAGNSSVQWGPIIIPGEGHDPEHVTLLHVFLSETNLSLLFHQVEHGKRIYAGRSGTAGYIKSPYEHETHLEDVLLW